MPRREAPVPRRAVSDDDYEDSPFLRSSKRIQARRRILPQTWLGRIFAALCLILVAAGAVAGVLGVRSFLLHDPRFLIGSSSAIQIQGNSHLSRPQLLSIFGEDVGGNLFRVPLADRRHELENLPWVEHATVMRLWPDRLRVAVVERTPVAFVRQNSQISLVDANGVLLDMSPDGPGAPHYSFPVVTGIAASDPASTRAARMKIYQRFVADLDSGGPEISTELSEVDLSDPEDVKALIPDTSLEILVHFGDQDFLARYQNYKSHLDEWRQQYPNLASVDMRYNGQAVLGMKPGTNGAPADANPSATENATPAASAASGSPTDAGSTPALSLPPVVAQKPAAPAHPKTSAAKKPAVKSNVLVKKPVIAPAGYSTKHPLVQAISAPVANKTNAARPSPAVQGTNE